MIAVVTGMIASYPLGGVVWDYGQYMLGLQRLGFDVYYLEDTGWQMFNPVTGLYEDDAAPGAAFLAESLRSLSPALEGRWHLRCMDGRTWGLASREIADVISSADLLLNVSGGTLLRNEYIACRRKVLIDTDPGYNHFVNFPKWDGSPGWHGSHGYRAHDYFFTYAERLGREGCNLPSMGLEWQATRPPVVLDQWQRQPPGDRWTTVMTWNNFGKTYCYEGREYGTKEIEFEAYSELPSRVPDVRFELAVGGSSAPRQQLSELGWQVRDSVDMSRTAGDYRRYIQASRGEFSVAKNFYVATRSGWFSCRSACYLAAGLPVVVQDTGWTDVLPPGDGAIAFSTPDEAIDGLSRVEGNYGHHCSAARQFAAEYLDAERVLSDLLERISLG